MTIEEVLKDVQFSKLDKNAIYLVTVPDSMDFLTIDNLADYLEEKEIKIIFDPFLCCQ